MRATQFIGGEVFHRLSARDLLQCSPGSCGHRGSPPPVQFLRRGPGGGGGGETCIGWSGNTFKVL